MKHRELIEATIRRAGHGGASGFWVGHPAAETKSIYSEALGLGGLRQEARVKGSILLSDNCDSREIEFQEAIGSDLVWVSPELDPAAWKHPGGRPMWDCFDHNRASLCDAGVFAECEDVAEVEALHGRIPPIWIFPPPWKIPGLRMKKALPCSAACGAVLSYSQRLFRDGKLFCKNVYASRGCTCGHPPRGGFSGQRQYRPAAADGPVPVRRLLRQ